MSHLPAVAPDSPGCTIQPHEAAPPIELPRGYSGPAWLPGTGRMIWWTGRVAIGLRHQPAPRHDARGHTESASWLQTLMLSRRRPAVQAGR